MSYAIEGLFFAMIGIYQFASITSTAIAEQDWQKIFGPNGVAFIAVCATVVLWLNGLKREKNEEKRRDREELSREKRHLEMTALHQGNANKLMELTAESIKSHGMSVAAISRMDRTIQALTEELKGRPCQINENKP
jgi:hypothetical protein